MVLERGVSRQCFTRRLTVGGPSSPRGPDGLPNGNQTGKKKPRQQGDTVRAMGRVVSGGSVRGLPRWAYNPIVLLRFASVNTYGKYIFFLLNYMFLLTELTNGIHNEPVPGPKWQGKSTFIVQVNQSSETTGPHVHPLFPFMRVKRYDNYFFRTYLAHMRGNP
jgi:hypothetical protein